jgi:transposase-like protein
MRHAKYGRTEYNGGMKKKNMYNPEFKSKVVLELLSGQHTLNELAERYQISPATLSSWHKQFQEHAADVFQRGATESSRELEAKEHEITVLQQKVGQLTIECDWLKKKYNGITLGSDLHI